MMGGHNDLTSPRGVADVVQLDRCTTPTERAVQHRPLPLPLTNSNVDRPKTPPQNKIEELRAKIKATEQRVELVKRLAEKDKQEWNARVRKAKGDWRRKFFQEQYSYVESSASPSSSSLEGDNHPEWGSMLQHLRKTNTRLIQEVTAITTEQNVLSRSNQRLQIANETALTAHQEFASYTTELTQIQQKFKDESEASKQRLERMKVKCNFAETCYTAESNSCRVYEELIAKIVRAVSEKEYTNDVFVQEINKAFEDGLKEVLSIRTRVIPASVQGNEYYNDGADENSDDETSCYLDSDSESSWWDPDDDSVGSFCS